MSEFLHRFSLQHARYTAQIFLLAGGLWLAVVISTWTSILSHPFSKRQKLFWCAVVTLLPLVGVLAYLPFSIGRDELPQMFLFRHSKGRRNRRPAPRA